MCASSARQTGSCWQDEGNFPRCTYRIPLHQKIAPYIISCCGPRICKGGIFLCKKAQATDLFSRIFESSREFKKVTTITTCAMFGALSVVLGYYSFKITPNLKIGFGSIPNMLVDYLFGPVVGGLFGGAMDVIKFMLKPDGGFMPGFTFNAMLAAFIYGLFFYKKNLSLPRILTAKLVVIILCNIILGTYWLTLLNGKGFLAILPARAIKNLIQWPVDSLIFFLVAKTLEQAGVFKIILHAGNRQRR